MLRRPSDLVRLLAAAPLAILLAGCDVLTPEPEPAALAFVAQPAGARGGLPFSIQPSVEIQDVNGKRVAGATSLVTVALGAGTGGGTLSGTVSVAAVAGVATFTDLVLDKVGSGYALTASGSGVSSATSVAFDVTAGPPSALRFVTQPAGALSGLAFSTQPVVEILDPGGNRVTDVSPEVTLGIGANPGSGRLSGTLTVPASSGLASYTNLAIDRAGSGYTLTASGAGLASDTSGGFDVPIRFASITVAHYMGCGRATDGTGYCWGRNQLGGLGIGTSGTNRSRPALLAGDLTFSVVDGGSGSGENGTWDGFGCGVTTGGVTHCWGRNTFGQLGNGNTGSDSPVPVPVSGGLTFVTVSAGQDHACALTVTGAAYCWGRNVIGALGNGTTVNSNVPVRVSGGHTWVAIEAGGGDTCALTTAGDLYCWGGQPSKLVGSWVTAPTRLDGDVKFKQISTGWFLHRCGVSTADQPYCWGQNFSGELGNGTDTTDSGTPVLVSGGMKFKSVQAGGQFSCGVTVAGEAYCWGGDFGLGDGRLGQGAFARSNTPLKVVGGLTFTSISVGLGQACGITASGAGYCWGNGYWGERGDGTFDLPGFTPVPIRPP